MDFILSGGGATKMHLKKKTQEHMKYNTYSKQKQNLDRIQGKIHFKNFLHNKQYCIRKEQGKEKKREAKNFKRNKTKFAHSTYKFCICIIHFIRT